MAAAAAGNCLDRVGKCPVLALELNEHLIAARTWIDIQSDDSGSPPCRYADIRLGHDLSQPARHDFDIVDAVVDEKCLPVAVELAEHGMANQLGIEPRHASLDGEPVLRRRFQI